MLVASSCRCWSSTAAGLSRRGFCSRSPQPSTAEQTVQRAHSGNQHLVATVLTMAALVNHAFLPMCTSSNRQPASAGGRAQICTVNCAHSLQHATNAIKYPTTLQQPIYTTHHSHTYTPAPVLAAGHSCCRHWCLCCCCEVDDRLAWCC